MTTTYESYSHQVDSPLMKIGLQTILFGLLFTTSLPQALAQSTELNLGCSKAKGLYRVYFTAYQAPEGAAGALYLKKYCEVIPEPGEVFMTLDVVRTNSGDIVRDRPVGVRVLEGAPGSEGSTLLELPPKTHSKGLIEIRPNLPDTGDYHIIVAIGKEASEDNTITIPVKVSAGLQASPLLSLLLILVVASAGYAAYLFYVRRQAQ